MGMPWIRRRLSIKALFLALPIVGIATYAIVVYSNSCSLTMAPSWCSVSQFYRSNGMMLSLTDTAWPNGLLEDHLTPYTGKVTDQSAISLIISTCKQRPKIFNNGSCPSCLRPMVAQLENHLRKIPYQQHLIPDQPADFFKVKKEIVQEVISDYFIVPNLTCPYLLVIQPSQEGRPQERTIVRETWASVAQQQTWPNRNINADVKVVFVLGRTLDEGLDRNDSHFQNNNDVTSQVAQPVQTEASKFNDILYLDIEDTYRNLTMKVMSAFKWVKEACPCVKFVLKVDFDTFVNVPLLVDTLLHFENKLRFSIIGMVYDSKSLVAREGRWTVNKSVYPMEKYPEYASGCGYVLSFQAMAQMVEAIPYFPMFAVEDAFITGVMRRVVNCDLYTVSTMFTHYLDKSWKPCRVFEDKKILATSDQGSKHKQIWQIFLNNHC